MNNANPLHGLTAIQIQHAREIAAYICFQTVDKAAVISAISFALAGAIGKHRFSKLLIHCLQEINESVARKSAGPQMFKKGIDKVQQAFLDNIFERLVRQHVKRIFYQKVEEYLTADDIVYACLYSADHQRRCGEIGVNHVTPDQKRWIDRTHRLKDYTLTTNAAMDFSSDSNESSKEEANDNEDDNEGSSSSGDVVPVRRVPQPPPVVKRGVGRPRKIPIAKASASKSNVPKTTSLPKPRFVPKKSVVLNIDVEPEEDECDNSDVELFMSPPRSAPPLKKKARVEVPRRVQHVAAKRQLVMNLNNEDDDDELELEEMDLSNNNYDHNKNKKTDTTARKTRAKKYIKKAVSEDDDNDDDDDDDEDFESD